MSIIIRTSSQKQQKQRNIFKKKLQSHIIKFLCNDKNDHDHDEETIMSWIHNTVSWNKNTWEFEEWSHEKFLHEYHNIANDLIPDLFCYASAHDAEHRLYPLFKIMTENGMHIHHIIDSDDDSHILLSILYHGTPKVLKWFLKHHFDVEQYTTKDKICPHDDDIDPLSEIVQPSCIGIILDWISSSDHIITLLECTEIRDMLNTWSDDILPNHMKHIKFMITKLETEIKSYNHDIELWSSVHFTDYNSIIDNTIDFITKMRDESQADLKCMKYQHDIVEEQLYTIQDLLECDLTHPDIKWPYMTHISEVLCDGGPDGPISPHVLAYISQVGGDDISSIMINRHAEKPITIVVDDITSRDNILRSFHNSKHADDSYITPSDAILVTTNKDIKIASLQNRLSSLKMKLHNKNEKAKSE